MNREQRIHAICVLWRNAEAAAGRREPMSAEECASIEEGMNSARRAELAELGVRDLEEDDIDQEYVYAEEVRKNIEIDASTLRRELISELVQLDASEIAKTLIFEILEDARHEFWSSLVEELATHGDFCAAREVADTRFSNDAQKRLFLRIQIHLRDPKPEELPLLRELAGHIVEEAAGFPSAAVAAFLDVWRLSSDPADLEVARALCRGIKTGLRLNAYQNIASRTGLVSDFLVAFRFAGRFASRQARAEGANQMIGQVWVSRTCEADPSIGRAVFEGTCPLSREDAERLLVELKKLSPLWAKVLRKKLEDHELL